MFNQFVLMFIHHLSLCCLSIQHTIQNDLRVIINIYLIYVSFHLIAKENAYWNKSQNCSFSSSDHIIADIEHSGLLILTESFNHWTLQLHNHLQRLNVSGKQEKYNSASNKCQSNQCIWHWTLHLVYNS